MSTSKSAAIKKQILNLGVTLGIVSTLLNVVTYTLSSNMFQPHWSIQVLGSLIMIAIIVMGIKAFRKENGGFLKLSDALKVGIGISLIAALIGAIYFAVFTTSIEPNYFDLYAEWQLETISESNPDLKISDIENGLEMQKPFMNTGVFVAVQVMIGLFFGFIISLITGLILKKEDPYAGIDQAQEQ